MGDADPSHSSGGETLSREGLLDGFAQAEARLQAEVERRRREDVDELE
jgi:hypothetical protein